MNAFAGRMEITTDSSGRHVSADKDLLELNLQPWGYVVESGPVSSDPSPARLVMARFAGAILVLAGFGLWLLPNSANTVDMLSMKLAVTVMFSLFGFVLIWAGRQKPGMELHVDTRTRELRVGKRDFRGDFHMYDRIDFSEVTSVYLMRSKGYGKLTRLYIRLGESVALEVTRGKLERMEALRLRLTNDLRRP